MDVSERIRATTRGIILSSLGSLLPTPKGPFLTALFFHDVDQNHIQNFESIVKRLRQIGDFVDTDTCVSTLLGQTPIQGRYFHLSFDDGHRDFFQNAAPILRRYKIPAIVFVPTAFIGTDKQGGVHNRMTWEELKILQSWGLEVGSHTRTHTKFGELTKYEMLEAEIFGSKKDIEENLHSECMYIAWPYGRKCDVTDSSLKVVAKAGYRACFGGFRGTIIPGRTNPFQIPRHHLEAEWPWSHIKYFVSNYK